ncbi:MAG: ATP-binding protein [Acidimicrobiales bacterium]
MKLATRLTILLIVITSVVALSVGWYAVNSSTHSAYNALNQTVNAVVESGIGTPDEALSDAINVDQKNNYDLTLDVVYPDGTATQLISANTPLRVTPTLADVRSSLSSVVSESNLPGFRIRSLNIGGGDYLLVAASTQSISRSNQQLILRVALAAVLAALAMVVVARLFMRRDLVTMEGLIGFASDVAEGQTYETVPPNRGSKDVRELQRALATMVRTLQEKIEVESRHAESMQLFIGDASHELRTPLTVIKGYTELISNPGVSDEQMARAVERMQREIGRRETLVSDLLLLAEIRELPPTSHDLVSLSEVVTTSLDEFRDDHPTRSVECDIEPDVTLRARRDLVERMMNNALGNIARHTPADAPVRVSLRRDQGDVELRVEDGGPGLPVYGQRAERFRRFDPSRSRESGGSGLGMSIMDDLSGVMNGEMTTSRSSLGGLCLTFRFHDRV